MLSVSSQVSYTHAICLSRGWRRIRPHVISEIMTSISHENKPTKSINIAENCMYISRQNKDITIFSYNNKARLIFRQRGRQLRLMISNFYVYFFHEQISSWEDVTNSSYNMLPNHSYRVNAAMFRKVMTSMHHRSIVLFTITIFECNFSNRVWFCCDHWPHDLINNLRL